MVSDEHCVQQRQWRQQRWTPGNGPVCQLYKKVQVGKDQEKAQSEKDTHSKNRGGKKNKLTIRYLYHETYRKPNEQLFSQ